MELSKWARIIVMYNKIAVKKKSQDLEISLLLNQQFRKRSRSSLSRSRSFLHLKDVERRRKRSNFPSKPFEHSPTIHKNCDDEREWVKNKICAVCLLKFRISIAQAAAIRFWCRRKSSKVDLARRIFSIMGIYSDAAFHISCGCMFWLLKNKQDAALFISERGARLASFAYLHSPAVHVLMSRPVCDDPQLYISDFAGRLGLEFFPGKLKSAARHMTSLSTSYGLWWVKE